MKKALTILTILSLCLGLWACGVQDPDPTTTAPTTTAPTPGTNEPTTETTIPEPTVDPDTVALYGILAQEVAQLDAYIAENRNIYAIAAVSYTDGVETYHYEGLDAIAWIYTTALELGDYEDAAEIAARFTVLEDVLLRVDNSHVDAFGNTVADSTGVYTYDHQGSLGYHFNYYAPKGMYDVYGLPIHTYDENGRITATTYMDGENTDTQVQFTYNDDGTVATEDYLNAGGDSYHIVYTYNNSGKLIKAEGVPYTGGGELTMTVTYTYNAAGQLIKETGIEDETDTDAAHYEKVVEYTYTDSGEIATRRQATLHYNARGRVTRQKYVYLWEYSYDETGRLTQTVYSSLGTLDADGDHAYNDTHPPVTGTYIYGTFYVYTPAA